MAPVPSLDLDIISGISGSISIACWVVVFTPQIIENFRRSSADGLSLSFIIVWLLGDVFNILGAVLQGVLPTMIILAVYYTVADIVLLGQCFYYRGFTFSDTPAKEVMGDEEAVEETPTEESALLAHSTTANTSSRPRISDANTPSRGSSSSLQARLANNISATHLSPATPFLPPPTTTSTPPPAPLKPRFALKASIFNTTALVLVCLAGVLGWYLSSRTHTLAPSHRHHHHIPHNDEVAPASTALHFDLWGQIFGYLCAVLYLGSRIPQLLLNHKRKSTEGVSMLFFLFACVGNLTYVLSIFAYEPACARTQSVFPFAADVGEGDWGCEVGQWREQYGRYLAVNASWLVGSAGTLVLDLMIFGQFWVYRVKGSDG